MEILTKYALGDKLYVIHNYKVVEFEVSEIIHNQEGTFYRGATTYHNFPESCVFKSREELTNFIMGNEE